MMKRNAGRQSEVRNPLFLSTAAPPFRDSEGAFP